MLKEIIRNQKIKSVIVVVIIIFLITVIYCAVQPRKENNSLISKKIESKEFSSISGDWKITEYLGESIEYHGAEATTEAERSDNDKIIKEIKEKYLNKELHLNLNNLTDFSPPTELGYNVLNWNDLFSIYRQPSGIWDGIATLVVKGQFFHLEKVATD